MKSKYFNWYKKWGEWVFIFDKDQFATYDGLIAEEILYHAERGRISIAKFIAKRLLNKVNK